MQLTIQHPSSIFTNSIDSNIFRVPSPRRSSLTSPRPRLILNNNLIRPVNPTHRICPVLLLLRVQYILFAIVLGDPDISRYEIGVITSEDCGLPGTGLV